MSVPSRDPLWPQPGETLWFRCGHANKWSVGVCVEVLAASVRVRRIGSSDINMVFRERVDGCLLYTSDAADE